MPSSPTAELVTRRCTSCGATVEIPATVMSASCRFCDASLVDAEASSEPVERVVPFVLGADQAATCLRGWLQSRWLAPEGLRKAAQQDSLRAVMVPFYAFRAVARTRWRARVGIYWYRTVTTMSRGPGGKTVTRTHQKRETDWHQAAGTHGRVWHDHLVSASRGLVEAEANALEPFDLGRAVPWAPERVAGLTAEVPTVGHDEATRTAAAELQERERQAIIQGFLPGDTHGSLETETRSETLGVELVLLPVWIAVFRSGEHVVRLLVNGQTGEVVGSVPWSRAKIAILVGIALAALAVIASLAGLAALFANLSGGH